MKNLFYCLPVVLCALLSACSGSSLTDPKSAADQAIKIANDSIPVKESVVLGEVPYCLRQSSLANKTLSSLYSEANDELMKGISNESDMNKASAKFAKLKDAKKVATELIKSHYNKIVLDAMNKINGKEIPCQFDSDIYSAAQAKIVVSNSSNGSPEMLIHAKLTPTTNDRWVQWDYLDADGKVIGSGANTFNGIVAGTPIDVDILGNWNSLGDFSKLSFHK